MMPANPLQHCLSEYCPDGWRATWHASKRIVCIEHVKSRIKHETQAWARADAERYVMEFQWGAAEERVADIRQQKLGKNEGL